MDDLKNTVAAGALDAGQLQKADDALKEASSALEDYFVNIPESEFQRLVHIAAKRMAFLDEFLLSVEHAPQYLPGFTGADKVAGLYQRLKAFTPLANSVDTLRRQIRAIVVSAGDELYKTAVVYLNAAQVAGKQGDITAQGIYDRLDKVRPNTAGKKKSPDTEDAGV
jgi:hypothetical protein